MTKIYEHAEFYNVNYSFENECWKQIEWAVSGYLISNYGRVKSPESTFTDSKILTLRFDTGYARTAVVVSEEKKYRRRKRRSFLIHVLLMHHFVGPRPTPNHDVNHKNGIKDDFELSNLEWVTKSENSKHAYNTGLHKKIIGFDHVQSIPVVQMDHKNSVVKIWGSASQTQQHGFNDEGVRLCAHGKLRTSGGFKWRWATKEEINSVA